MNNSDEHILWVRDLIKKGATIPGCLRAIQNRVEVDHPRAVEILRAAFCLGPGVTQKASAAFSKPDDSKAEQGLATFLILPQIIRSRTEWDESSEQTTENWFNALACSSPDKLEQQALATIQGSRVWENVPPAVRDQYLTVERSRLKLSEFGEIVARLAEQLQRRVEELEAELATRKEHGLSQCPAKEELSSESRSTPAPVQSFD